MQWDISKQVAVAIIRWLLFSAGAWLVKKGIIDQSMADAWVAEAATILAGAILILIPIVWKYLNAKFHFLTLVEAVQTTPPANNKSEIKAAVQDVKATVSANNTVAPL